MARRRHTPEQIITKLRDELLDREIFYPLWEAQVLIEHWQRTYSQNRPRSALSYRPPAPKAILPTSPWRTRPVATAAQEKEVLMPPLT